MIDKIVYFYPEGHSDHYEHGHPECPERVEVNRRALFESGLWDIYPRLNPTVVDDNLIQSIHSPAYLNLLEMTCRRGGHLDPDTFTTTASWELAHRVAGGAVAVATAVWEGKASRGFVFTRHTGHT